MNKILITLTILLGLLIPTVINYAQEREIDRNSINQNAIIRCSELQDKINQIATRVSQLNTSNLSQFQKISDRISSYNNKSLQLVESLKKYDTQIEEFKVSSTNLVTDFESLKNSACKDDEASFRIKFSDLQSKIENLKISLNKIKNFANQEIISNL